MRLTTLRISNFAAAIGVVVAFLAIWLDAISVSAVGFGRSYWDLDRTFGIYLLALTSICAVLLLIAPVRRKRLELVVAAVGAILFGSLLLFPAVFAFDRFDYLGAGGWLGLCSALLPLGAVGAYTRTHTPSVHPDPIRQPTFPRLVAAAGLALVLSGIWLQVQTGGDGTYWSSEGDHSLGILIITLVASCMAFLLFASARSSRSAELAAAATALVLFGLLLNVPVTAAFSGLGELRAGAWLPLAGGVLLATSVLLSWRRLVSRRDHQTLMSDDR